MDFRPVFNEHKSYFKSIKWRNQQDGTNIRTQIKSNEEIHIIMKMPLDILVED